MNRLNIKEQVLNVLFLLLLQWPLVYRVTLYDHAFAFFYVGFLILLPTRIRRAYLMLIAFFVGLSVDVFTNTPGMHAFSCVLIMFIRNFWLSVLEADWQELANLNIITLRKRGFTALVFPLVFVHHLMLFTLENGGLRSFLDLTVTVVSSAVLSFALIFSIHYLMKATSRSA